VEGFVRSRNVDPIAKTPEEVETLRRAFRAAVLSSLLPGAGQLYLGCRRRGLALLAVALLPPLGAAVTWILSGGSLLRDLLRPAVRAALLAGNALLAAFRLFAAFDAYQFGRAQERPPRLPSWARVPVACGGLLALVGVTLAPHAVVGYYNAQAYHTINSVFAGGSHASQFPGLPGSSASAEPKRAAAGAGMAAAAGRLTVLLLGGDAGPGRVGLRTDTMIVASVDPATRRVTLIGLPRNLTHVPLSGRAAGAFPCHCFPGLLNALYRYAEGHPELFPNGPDRGAMAVKDAAAKLLGVKIDHYALVDLAGFVDVVDALGGVTVNVSERIADRVSPPRDGQSWPSVDVRPGRYHFDGRHALAYVRSRTADDDYHRMRRQRCLLAGLASQANLPTMLRALPRLLRVARASVHTDIPAQELPQLAALATGLRGATVTTLGLTPPRFSRIDPDGYRVVKVSKVRAGVAQALNPSGHPATAPPAGASQQDDSTCS